MVCRTTSRISRMNTRFTERVRASRTVMVRALSLGSKFSKWCRPPPVKKPSPGLAEYVRSIAASSIGRRLRSLAFAQIVDRPARDGVLLGDRLFPELFGRQRGKARVQPGDDLEIADERAELGGGAEVELGAFVDVERLVVVVGLHAQRLAPGRASYSVKL